MAKIKPSHNKYLLNTSLNLYLSFIFISVFKSSFLF